MTAPHYRDSVLQGKSLKRPVGFAVLQHHVEAALLMLRLRIRQSQFGHFLALFLVLHLHFIGEAFRRRVVKKMHCVVVHAGHREVPLHLLVIREITGIVGCDEVCV